MTTEESHALLSDFVRGDAGYCNQRLELAGREADRETLAKYPIVVGHSGAPIAHARAVVWYDSESAKAWSPLLRKRIGDDFALWVSPIGTLIDLYGLKKAACWLPLTLALLRGTEGWVVLANDGGHVLLGPDRRVIDAKLSRTLEADDVDIGLHALRLGHARSVAPDSAFFTLASAQGVNEHLEELPLNDDSAWQGGDGVFLTIRSLAFVPPAAAFKPLIQSDAMHAARLDAAPGAYELRAERWTPPAGGSALWRYLEEHRFGFDLSQPLTQLAPIEEFILPIGLDANLVARWVRIDAASPGWATLCAQHGIHRQPSLACPWTLQITHYVSAISSEEPALAVDERERDVATLRAIEMHAGSKLDMIVDVVLDGA